MNENNEKEYITFQITDKNGNTHEMAVIDEFEFEHKFYVASAIVENDTINEEGIYIYKIDSSKEEFEVEKIADPKEYEKVAKAYVEMSE